MGEGRKKFNPDLAVEQLRFVYHKYLDRLRENADGVQGIRQMARRALQTLVSVEQRYGHKPTVPGDDERKLLGDEPDTPTN